MRNLSSVDAANPFSLVTAGDIAHRQWVGSAALAAAIAAVALLATLRTDADLMTAGQRPAAQEVASIDAPTMRLAAAWRRAAGNP
jgi:hypothetical protein